MSSKAERTQNTILDAALTLFREHGPGHVSVGAVAERAGLTRQAVYLHFASRTKMMLALMDHIGRQKGVHEMFKPLPRASAREELEAKLRATAQYGARIHEVATALDLARHTDEGAAAAWNSRMEQRRRGIGQVVRRLKIEGSLREGWSVARVVDALWSISTPHSYADLVVERGWSLADYERFLICAAQAFLKPKNARR